MSAGQNTYTDRGMNEPSAERSGSTSQDQNKDIVRRSMEQVWKDGNTRVVDEFYANNYVDHTPAPGFTPDREGIRGTSKLYHAAFPDLDLMIDELVAEGDRVAARFTVQGTHEGDLQGIPPTGKHIRINGMTINRVQGGKIVESWELTDQFSLLQQLGATQPPASPMR
jgi:steroid delta-isomerase-like uncharacterized protein